MRWEVFENQLGTGIANLIILAIAYYFFGYEIAVLVGIVLITMEISALETYTHGKEGNGEKEKGENVGKEQQR